MRLSGKILALLCLACLIVGCRQEKSVQQEFPLPDTLFVGTLYSPTSFFIYKNDTLGYEYERIMDFARTKGIHVAFRVASNMSSMLEMLADGSVQILAYEIPETAEFKDSLTHCGLSNTTYQVLVQLQTDSTLTDVTQLVGRDVYVERNSKYESRLQNLNNEIGGGINIHYFSKDTLITEDLIEMVSDGDIPLAVVDSDIARLNRTYYNNINIDLRISFPQRSSWAVSKANKWLADSVNAWAETATARSLSKELLKRYFELSKGLPSASFHLKPGEISPYDSIFRKYAPTIGWDWKMLAAIAFTESQFDPTVVSWAGARGIMQLMPGTARAYGLDPEEIEDPECSVKAAVASIKDLIHIFEPKVKSREELIRFVLAAYNSGAGHILDAIALAEKYGKDPALWYDNVEEAVMWKSNPQYYNDPVCRFGYFRGKQTVNYVPTVENHYLNFSTKSQKK